MMSSKYLYKTNGKSQRVVYETYDILKVRDISAQVYSMTLFHVIKNTYKKNKNVKQVLIDSKQVYTQ